MIQVSEKKKMMQNEMIEQQQKHRERKTYTGTLHHLQRLVLAQGCYGWFLESASYSLHIRTLDRTVGSISWWHDLLLRLVSRLSQVSYQ